MSHNNFFQRWRHAHGYGVHSPFGYQLVTRAVTPGPYAWYGYEDIENSMPTGLGRRMRREARMFLRLLTTLRPASVFIPNGIEAPYLTALHAADSRINVTHALCNAADCELICSHGDFVPLDIIRNALHAPGHWVVLRDVPEGWDDGIFDALPEGLMFRGKRNLCAIHHPGQQKVLYPMSI